VGIASSLLFSAGGGRLRAQGTGGALFAGSTAWDRLLSQDAVPLAYFVEIEPWVLTDRS